MSQKIRLAVLGATGMAGREALLHHAWLDKKGLQYAGLTCVTGGPESVGNCLGDVVYRKERKLEVRYPFWDRRECPESLENLVVDTLDVELVASKADYCISALDASIAYHVEPELSSAGVVVFSNASAHRWGKNVPLLIPEVNPKHLTLLKEQRKQSSGLTSKVSKGGVVCNPNCTTAGFVPIINALQDIGYTIKHIHLSTQQSLSGKGDAVADEGYVKETLGNVRDDWTGSSHNAEELKTAQEPMKILGRVRTQEEWTREVAITAQGRPSAIIPIYAQTTRVATQYGHLACLWIQFDGIVDSKKIRQQLDSYKVSDDIRRLPTTPARLFSVIDRMPEPKTDVFKGDGMSIVIGDITQHTQSMISLFTLSHNLRRGATWAGRQGLELYLYNYRGMFRDRSRCSTWRKSV